MDNSFYTYAYLRKDGTPYYIGKGKGYRAFRKAGHTIKLPPRERILILKKNLTEEEAFKHEVYLIAVLGRKDLGTGILRNLTDGGEGARGWIPSEEAKIKISKGNKGKSKNKGIPKSEEHRQNLSNALKGRKGRPQSTETREKLSKINKERKRNPHSETTKERISQSAKNRSADAWKKHRKAIVIDFPSGRIGIFSSLGLGADYLGVNLDTISRWAQKGVKPKGKFKNYNVRLSDLA